MCIVYRKRSDGDGLKSCQTNLVVHVVSSFKIKNMFIEFCLLTIMFAMYYLRRTRITCKVLSKDAIVPKYQTVGAAGFDFHACGEPVEVKPNEMVKVPTGLAFDIPRGYEVQVRSRSGMTWKHQVVVANSPGTIDSDYHGEIFILLFNMGNKMFVVKPGMRVAQGVLSKVEKGFFKEGKLGTSQRGSRGFGSSGY